MRSIRISLGLSVVGLCLFGCVAATKGVPPGEIVCSLPFKESGSKPIELEPVDGVKWVPVAFRVRNDTATRLAHVKVLGEKDPDIYDLDNLLNTTLKGANTPEEKAQRLWQLVQRYMYAAHPAHEDARLHDPLVMFRNYGYGYCDDFAWNLASLWREIGLNSRVWGLSGHVVSEVYYDGGWHLYDAHTDTGG